MSPPPSRWSCSSASRLPWSSSPSWYSNRWSSNPKREAARLLHRERGFGGLVPLRRLPQLDPGPFGVRDPAESAVLRVLDLRVDVDPLFPQHREKTLQGLYTGAHSKPGGAFAPTPGRRRE